MEYLVWKAGDLCSWVSPFLPSWSESSPGSTCRIAQPKPSGSLTTKRRSLADKLELEAKGKDIVHHASIRTVLFNGRVWTLALIYFGFIYGLYALAFFLPTIIAGFEAQYGTKFNVYQKGLITGI